MAKTHTLSRLVQIDRRTPSPSGYGSVKSGTRSAWVELFIDADRLMNQLGTKALHSKGGKARMANGAIEVKVQRHTIVDSES